MSETGHEYRKQYPIIRPSVLKELAHGICVSNLAFHTGKQKGRCFQHLVCGLGGRLRMYYSLCHGQAD